ncbi:TonB-dependent receptor [Rubellicoccus peritrichatus]|uniref:TonB-dependent receptor n=1 Tax=Rubellicoccus peritrichatus TaxID=3080537 RepID=A0AAQ3L956_9BACT|nr:TonB-dependent receptor [Puniceicoccus sp. CR14]WOO39997.1 TonB-dependent receptor [Puniceicoccus sp. CR14]
MKDPQMEPKELTTNRKAFLVNLDQNVYGTFAEIGAGQEVARHFFKVGGAAGTIAKSMSAYDMKFSDEIYGKASRYVSRERLIQMLDHEYALLNERLSADRGKDSTFFVYANTVAAASYHSNKNCHGWMGMRYQIRPEAPPNDIIVHVRMWDKTPTAQQEALGMFGVNFIWASLIYFEDIDMFVSSLIDHLGIERIEVDMLEFHGPDFKKLDNRIVAMKLVENGLTNAVMFGPDGNVRQPSEELYKKCILVERGSFRPVTHVNLDMLTCAGAQFVQEDGVQGEEVMAMLEMTMKNLLGKDEQIDYDDFKARIDTISALGYHVLVSNYMEYYRLSAYFRRFTQKTVGMVLGINHLQAIFDEDYYDHLDGGILESVGRLFKANVKMYVYPMKGEGYNSFITGSNEKTSSDNFAREMVITADNLKVQSDLRHLYAYLLENHYIEPVVGANISHLEIFSRETLKQIAEGDPEWEKSVPREVVDVIKERNFWGYSEKNDE